MEFKPQKIYYEKESLKYESGKYLHEKYSDIDWIEIENHNNIPFFRNNENREFSNMKKNIIVGIRKTHKFILNNKISNFLVPYTSSGCTASCLYCYLVCNYNKCSYLRIFVNREKMLEKIINTSRKSAKTLTFEIGSNSDLILENTITNNLQWTIENFANNGRGFLTLPTKFDMIDGILGLNHQGKIIIRVSVNPDEIIRKVEFGTSPLKNRINALNKLCDAGYKVGLLIAPIVLIENWKDYYSNLFIRLESELRESCKKKISIEIIFMTYSYIHRAINNEAFSNAIELYDKKLMTGRGRGKYCYRPEVRKEAEIFIKQKLLKHLPKCKIAYIV